MFQKRQIVGETRPWHIKLDSVPSVIYAVGDVHGCLDKLKRLEAGLVADAADRPGEKLIVMLGDYIDRGPQSAQTINWLLKPPPAGFSRICLRGNHEALFLDAIEHPERCRDWLTWGGMETLASYGIDAHGFRNASAATRKQILQGIVPEEHVAFLRHSPVLVEAGPYVFVHAGIRPGVPLDRQAEKDLIWIRDPFLSEPHGLPVTVVHGHTPKDEPVWLSWRIGIDTHAYDGGPLTAVRLVAGDGAPAFYDVT